MSDFKTFIDVVHTIENRAVLEDFLIGITTKQERQSLTQRIEIVKQLLSGKPHAKIAQDLGVGIATVTRGSKELKEGRFKALRK